MNKMTQSLLELKNPRLLKLLNDKNSEFTELIVNVARKVEPIIEQRIPKVFSTYTLHDTNHSIRIMDYMYDLITDHDKISDLDIALLILSALLHDIGMAVFDEEIDEIINGKYNFENFSYNAVLKKYNNNKEEALREFIRRVHGERSAEFIKQKLDEELRIPSQPATTLTEDIANICLGHTKNISWLQSNLKTYSQKASSSYSSLYCGMLLRLADILDIDSQRTPPFLYDLLTLNDISDDEWLKHFDIHNVKKVTVNELKEKTIRFFGECKDASIHRKILEYLDWVNDEIQNATDLNSILNENYKFNLRYPLENHIESKGYKISNLKLSIDFNAISNLLMGENIYGSKQLGLRELVQNAIDACKVREEIEKSQDVYGLDDYKPTISIILDRGKNEFIVKDNGIGMSFEILKNYFLNIGVSYYKSDDYTLRDFKYKPIGNFGIGFLACFMLSEKVNIKTKHINDDIVNYLYLEKNSPYISFQDESLANYFGTEIRLNYKEVMEVFNSNPDNIVEFLEKNFLTDKIEIKLIEQEKDTKVIKNLLQYERKINKGEHVIHLKEYLNDIQGSIIIDVKNKRHGNHINDIPFRGEAYFFDGEKLNEEFQISKLYDKNNHCVKYLEIPILTSSIYDEYQRNYDVLQDAEEAIERLEDQVDWVTIFYDSNHTKLILPEKNNVILTNGDRIFREFGFEQLIEMNQDEYLPTCVYHMKYNLYYSFIEKLFISFYSEEYARYYATRRNLLRNNYEDIYIKNVCIPKTSFYLDKMWNFIKLKSYKINILNSRIKTDVSRNELDYYSTKELQYALNKCICLWVLDKLELSVNEGKLLNEFMEKFYVRESSLIKKER